MLHGFAPGDRYRIGDAVERELERLFAEQGVPPSLAQGGDRDYVDGGGFESPRAIRAGEVGARIAQNLYGGLK